MSAEETNPNPLPDVVVSAKSVDDAVDGDNLLRSKVEDSPSCLSIGQIVYAFLGSEYGVQPFEITDVRAEPESDGSSSESIALTMRYMGLGPDPRLDGAWHPRREDVWATRDAAFADAIREVRRDIGEAEQLLKWCQRAIEILRKQQAEGTP